MQSKTMAEIGPRSGAYGRSGEMFILDCFHTQLVWILVSSIWSYFRDATSVDYNIPRDCRLYVEPDNCPCCIYIIFYGGFTECYRTRLKQWLKRSQKEKGNRYRKWRGEWNGNEVSGARGICDVNLHSRKAANSTNHHRMDKIVGSGVRKTTRAIELPSML